MSKENRYSTAKLADNIREDYKPTNSGEMLGGLIIIVVAGLVAYAMYLYNRRTSPSAKAEQNLKNDLINEITDFKIKMNTETNQRDRHVNGELARLDKQGSLLELVQANHAEKMHTLEMNLNQNFTGLHTRFGKLEESVLLLVAQGRSENQNIM